MHKFVIVNLRLKIIDGTGNLHTATKAKEVIKNDKRRDLLKIIDAGADVSNFGDPSSW